MQDQEQVRRIPVAVVAGLSAVLVTAGSGAAWWAWHSILSSPTPPTPTTAQSPKPVQPPVEETVQVYWLNDANNKIEVVPNAITLKDTDQSSEILEAALKQLLAGPVNPAFTTTIPEGTKLRDVSVKPDGVHVDLSEEFTSGGGSASMTGRVAQVLYTASTLDPTTKVWIEVEGKPLEVLGGEGIELEQPLTRENFDENFDL